MSPFSLASKSLLSCMLMGVLSFQPFRLLSMVTMSPWNIKGRLRLFSSSSERLRLRVIAEAKGAVRCINLVFSFGAFLLFEFFAPMAGTHTHLHCRHC